MGRDLHQHLEHSMLNALHHLDGDEGRIELDDWLNKMFTSAESWFCIRGLVESCKGYEPKDFVHDLFVNLLKPQDHYRSILKKEKGTRAFIKKAALNLARNLFKKHQRLAANNCLAGTEDFVLLGDIWKDIPSSSDRKRRNQKNYEDKAKLRLKLKQGDRTVEENICSMLKVDALQEVPTEDLHTLANLVSGDNELQEFIRSIVDRRSSYAV